MILIPTLLIHLLLLINLRFEAWPEMLVYPYLINHGFRLYTDIVNAYPPLLSYFLAGWFYIFGLSVFNLQLFTWLVILITEILIYVIARQLYGKKPAVIALAFFIIFQPLLDGNGLWHDLFQTPILLLAFYWQSPFLLSLAFFIKQTVIFLFPIFFKKWRQLTVSLICLFLVSCFLLFIQGSLNDYLFWAWQFPFSIFPSMPGQKDFGNPRLWLIALTPFIPLVFSQKILNRRQPHLWAILSILFIFPRFGLFHLQPALAFTALSLAASFKSRRLHFYALTLLMLLALPLWFRHLRLFWRQPVRFFEPEIILAGQRLATLTQPHQPVFTLNAPDQLLVIADRLPPKPWADTFPWLLETPHMQDRLIAAIARQQVQAVVFMPYQNQDQFMPGSYRPSQLDDFIHQYFPDPVALSDNIKLLLPESR